MQIFQRPLSLLLSRKAVLPLIVLAIAAVALAGRSMRSFSTVTSAPVSSPTHVPVQPSVAVTQSSQIRTELITILPTGFDPTEIRLTDGQFRIAVDNKSGLDEVTLRLTREGGARVREMRLPMGQLKWREKLNLRDGAYSLTEANHANWRCRIVVTS
jgi:hypothetical protein